MKKIGKLSLAVLSLTVMVTGLCMSRASAAVTTDTATSVWRADGFAFPEGPAYHVDQGLVFSDVNAAKIIAVDFRDTVTTSVWYSGEKTNGLAFSKDGRRLYACSPSAKAVLALDTATRSVVAGTSGTATHGFHGPNDIVVGAKGYVYFTDPKWSQDPNTTQGIYRWREGESLSTTVWETTGQPNGLALSPDGRALFVARSGMRDIIRIELDAEGIGKRAMTFVQLPGRTEPDGIEFDDEGTLYVAQANDGVLRVLRPDGTTQSETKLFDVMCTNIEIAPTKRGTVWVTGGGRAGKLAGAILEVKRP